MAFTTNRNSRFSLWVSNADGSEPFEVMDFPGQYINTPRWSPDGKQLVFQGYVEGQADIFRVNALGGIPENLTNSVADEHAPYYAPDGETIYYSSNRDQQWQVWSMKASGRERQQLTTDGGYAPQALPTGKGLVYVKKALPGLWLFDLEKEEEKLIDPSFNQQHYGAFALANEGLYLLDTRAKSLCFQRYGEAEKQPLSGIKRIPRIGISLSYSPKTDRLIYAQVDHIDSDIMMLVKQ